MFQRQSTNNLPGWLWFFLILPITLIVALLYKRQRLPAVLQQQLQEQLQRVTHQPPLYSEPDSIPLDMSDVHPAAVPFEVSPSQAVAPAAMVEEALGAEPAEPEQGLAGENVPLQGSAGQPLAEEESRIPGAEPKPGDTQAVDDLKVIEGIGPAIARLLNENGIRSYRDLASTPVARLQEILTSARLSRLANPATWPEQAGLAAEARWEALDDLQRSLKGGRRKVL